MSETARINSIAIVESKTLTPEEFTEELHQLTFDELLGSASAVARLMDYPEEAFDPKTIVGELLLNPESGEDLRAAIRRKVDGLHHVISEFEAYSAREKIRSNRHAKRAQRAINCADSIKKQIKFVMDSNNFEKVAGNEFVIRKTAKTMANCSLIVDRDPTAADMLSYDFVTEIPVSYDWKNAEMKDALKTFYKALKDQPDCKYCEGRKKLVVVNEIITCPECHGTGVLIPDGVEVPAAMAVSYLEWSSKIVFEDIDRPEVTAKKPRKKKATVK